MEFEFAKYTEITDLAFQVNPSYKTDGYVRFFICPDVNDFWFVRILKDHEYTDDEGYIENEGHYILERNMIPKDFKKQQLTINKAKSIILEDDGSNWDFQQGYDLEELVDMLDQGFGIINRQEVNG